MQNWASWSCYVASYGWVFKELWYVTQSGRVSPFTDAIKRTANISSRLMLGGIKESDQVRLYYLIVLTDIATNRMQNMSHNYIVICDYVAD